MGLRCNFRTSFMWVLLTFLIGTQGVVAAETTQSPITIAINSESCLCNLPVIVADRVGFFRSEGVNVVVEDFRTDIAVHDAFLKQQAEIASGPLVHVLTSEQQTDHEHPAAIAFVSTTQSLGLVLLTHAPESTSIFDVSDLQGSKVGVTSSPAMAALVLDRLLEQHDVALDAVELIRFGDEASAIHAMLAMDVDALIVPDPVATYLERGYAAQVLYDFRQSDVDLLGTGLSSVVLYADPEWVMQHEEEVTNIATALIKANRWLQERPIEEVLHWIPMNLHRDDSREPFDEQLLIEALELTIPAFSSTGLIEIDPGTDEDDLIQNVTQAFVQNISASAKEPLHIFLATNGLPLLELLSDAEADFWQSTFETLPGVFVMDDPLAADVLINILVTQVDNQGVFSAQLSSTDRLTIERMPLLITLTAPVDDPDAVNELITTLPRVLLTWLSRGAMAWWEVLP